MRSEHIRRTAAWLILLIPLAGCAHTPGEMEEGVVLQSDRNEYALSESGTLTLMNRTSHPVRHGTRFWIQKWTDEGWGEARSIATGLVITTGRGVITEPGETYTYPRTFTVDERIFECGGTYRFQERLTRPDGEYVWIHSEPFVVVGDDC